MTDITIVNVAMPTIGRPLHATARNSSSWFSARGPMVSGHALVVTFGWLAAAMVLGVAAGIPLARTVAAAQAPVA